MMQKLKAYAQLMRLHRPIGTLLLLWPTLWALWIAGQGKPNPVLVLIFLLGVFFMRSAGCVINDIADRKLDGKVERTKGRPLITGVLSTKEALSLFILLCFVALLLLVPLNMLARLLALPAIALAVIYPLMKRYTHLPQVVLGLAFSWGIPMAFAAQTNTVPLHAWCLFLIATLWPVAYDTIYAMVDRDDDLNAGIKSTAILFGSWDTNIVAILHGVMILFLLLIGAFLEINWGYYLGLVGAAGIMLYQQRLILHNNKADLLKAFEKSHWVGLAVFVGIILGYL